MLFYQILAAAEPSADQGIFGALGIDWTLLIVQMVAFVILLAVLKKFVYPPFMAAVDKREASLKEISEASEAAREGAEKNKQEVEALLDEARKEAAAIVSTAKDEAENIVSGTEEKARANAERIVSDARAEIEREVEIVKKELHNQTVELVALATEKVIGKTNSKNIDNQLIVDAIKESK